MAIRMAADFRLRVRVGVCLLAGILTLCTAAGAQVPLVTTGSVITIPANNTWGQIYKIIFYKGNVLALDAGNDALYQLAPGASTWNTLVAKGGILGDGFNAQGMTIDAQGTLYITIAYASSLNSDALFWRVPYVNGTWSVTASTGWGDTIIDTNTGNAIVDEADGDYTDEAFFQNSPQMDGSGTLYWMATSPNEIWSVPVDKNGNAVNGTSIVTGLKAGQGKIAVDASGNIYFVEYHGVLNNARDTGIWFIPAGQSGLVGVGSPIVRIDAGQASSTTPIVYAGVTLDGNGDLYLTSENNSNYDETVAGVWEIPNTCGPTGVTASNVTACLNWNNTSMVAPIDGNQPLSIDSRGYLWIPSYQASWPPSNDNGPYPGVGSNPGIYGIVVWEPGALNLNLVPSGPTPTGAPGSAGILYYTFNSGLTPGGFQFSSAPGTVPAFGTTATNPIPPTTSTSTPAAPCNTITNGAYPTFSAQNWCELWVTVDPTAPGAVSGELTLLDSSNKPVPGSTVYVNGTGEGPGVSMLDSPQLNTLAAGLKTPAQVAADAIGDTWVADPGNKQVLYFPAGSSGAKGTSIGTGLSEPTGVAVDGSGDVYIADSSSGNVYEIPCASSSTSANGCAYGTPTTVATGLGTTGLNLAADGSGDVYVADPANARVVKIPNPAQSGLITSNNTLSTTTSTTITVGSGFTAPSAVAVDSFGDVYVADSGNLYEVSVPPQSAQTEIVEGSLDDVTGLAVDASGSVIVAESGGMLRIPFINGGLSVNSAGPLDNAVAVPSSSTSSVTTVSITSPSGVALDQTGNLYVIDMSNGPNLYQLSINGFVNFGVGLVPTELTEQDVPLVNIGNEPLSLVAANPISFSGGTATEDSYFSIGQSSGGTECDPTGDTSVAAGAACTLGAGFTPPLPPAGDTGSILYSGVTMTVPTNATNVAAGTVSAGLQGSALAGLEPTQTTVQVNLTSAAYPGSASVTVSVAPEPTSSVDYPNNVPSGTVTLTLSCATAGCTQAPIVQTAQATGNNMGTTATFSLANLLGGNYNVSAAYGGNTEQLFQKSTGTATFAVGTAAPVITLSEPLGVSPNATNGVYYVLYQGHTTLSVNVSSSLGNPTGTVTILNNGTAVGTATYTQGQNWTFATGSLQAGSYNLTAVYSGDQNFSSVTSSPAVTFQVIPESVLLTASPATVSTKAGTPVTSTIAIQSLVGFSATTGANITCEVAPQDTVPSYAECTFSNPQPEICAPTPTNGCTPATTVVTLSSNIPVNIPTSARNVPMVGPRGSPMLPAGIFGLGLLGLALRRRRIFNRYLLGAGCLALFLAGSVLGISSCTNSSYSRPPKVPTYTTPAGTYNVSIIVSNPSTGTMESLPFTLGVTIQ
jgi:hypothetical protein